MKKLPKKINVYVTAKDIKEGFRGRPKSCPIARSLTRRGFLDLGYQPHVGPKVVQMLGDGHTINYRLPLKAIQFILDFDYRRPNVKPIRFTIRRKY